MAELTKREKSAVGNASAEQLVEPGNAFLPDIDIFDSNEGLILKLDIPGVRQGNVSVEIDENNILTIHAKNSFTEPEGNKILNEFDFGDYYRAFSISNEFDKNKVAGKINNGVLEVRIPRREDAKPRRIQINA